MPQNIKLLLAILLLGVGVIMGIEQFVLEKGESLFAVGGAGKIDNRLGEIVLSLSQNYPCIIWFFIYINCNFCRYSFFLCKRTYSLYKI